MFSPSLLSVWEQWNVLLIVHFWTHFSKKHCCCWLYSDTLFMWFHLFCLLKYILYHMLDRSVPKWKNDKLQLCMSFWLVFFISGSSTVQTLFHMGTPRLIFLAMLEAHTVHLPSKVVHLPSKANILLQIRADKQSVRVHLDLAIRQIETQSWSLMQQCEIWPDPNTVNVISNQLD